MQFNNTVKLISFENTNGSDIKIEGEVSKINTKGKIVYEYNPLRNFRNSEEFEENGITIPAKSIIDLETPLLNFSTSRPVEIEC
jgi:hypothetical protein